ncbi:MAG: 1-acyl-sn-glycerol-3-phosphate acyltransferase [Clostridia bacterium]|nr:1-acyl-sn-glycerol-3-phosphate acyltransferase [Clostridia bacterium]MBQ6931379.1 1-acyl-sn-glycerol-3-phosphate acyltransferase [Clostridia bacterium]
MKEPLLYKIVKPPLKALFTLVFRPTVEGKENIPAEGKIILAGNHTSVFDCFTVAVSTKRCVHFMAKAELMNGIGKHIFPGLGIIPVDRSTNGKQAVVTAEEYLNDGKLVAIFPEGTTNKTDDIMMPFKGGAVKIASDTDCDIVPFVISGKYKYFKKSVKIKFMPVMKVERGSLKAANKALYETVRNELEKEYGVKK